MSCLKLAELRGELVGAGRKPVNTTNVSQNKTVIDPVYGSLQTGIELRHRYLRLPESVNLWRTDRGLQARRKIELSLSDVHDENVDQIVARAEVVGLSR